MACTSTGVNDRRLNQFDKIKLLDSIANSLVSYGVQSGNVQLADYVDLNCGAVPEGSFEQVIDLNAPHQFLSLYMGIAEKRFAFAVTELIKMNAGLEKACVDFVANVAKDMKVSKVENAEQAFEVLQSIVLDGMPCDETKNVISSSAERVEWEKVMDTHEEAWKAAGGKLEVYYELQESFVNALFAESGVCYKIIDGLKFSLCKN